MRREGWNPCGSRDGTGIHDFLAGRDHRTGGEKVGNKVGKSVGKVVGI